MLTEKNICYNCFQEISETEKVCPHCGYDHEEASEKYPMALKAGSILNGQYILGRVLGQGGFGITYLALDYNLGIKLAIKEYLPETMAIRETDTVSVRMLSTNKQEDFNYGADCFLKEARLLAQFSNNPNVVSVRNYFSENNTAYFVMEYIEGISFKEYIKNHGGKIHYEDALRIMLPVLDGLSAVHQEGIIHRDVAPDNIYITKDNAVKLLDFGSARYSIGDRSRSLDVIIKAGYAPKEQYTRRGRQGPYTDVYSAAACLYASITGYLPPEALDRLDEDDLVGISTYGIKIPEAIEDAILKGLEVQPEDRFQSIAEFKQALTGSPIPPVPPNPPDPEPSNQDSSSEPSKPIFVESNDKTKRKKQIIIGVSAAVLLLILAISGVLLAIGNNAKNNNSKKSSASVSIPKSTIETTVPSATPRPTPTPSPTPQPVTEINPQSAMPTIFQTNNNFSATASSTLPNMGTTNYYAGNLLDKNTDTAWVEGIPSTGGEGVSLTFTYEGSTPMNLTGVAINNGYIKNDKTFVENGYVKRLAMAYNGKLVHYLNLKVQYETQFFNMPTIILNPGDTLTFTIEATEPGPQDGELDTAMTGVIFY